MDKKYPIAVAPMMEWTDRHCRYFLRLISPRAILYTEMVTTGAILYGDRDRFLGYAPCEHPLVLQLGGSDPEALGLCARIGADYGYTAINLNCGCPSPRVQEARFGACLMKEPDHVGACLSAMKESSGLPVSVKCRIGVDSHEGMDFLSGFLETVSRAGCDHVILHARKAWLDGLSPKENREIPPLDYDLVEVMARVFPRLHITLNGGIETAGQAVSLVKRFESLMIGRAAYHDPYAVLGELEQQIAGGTPVPTRREIALAMIPYIDFEYTQKATPMAAITRHMLGLYHAQRGGRHWRRILTEQARDSHCARTLIHNALPDQDTPEAL